ncbi:cell division protein ZipA [Halioglobus sp. Uisw_031]|jgi:cell division protein ZipA|uniref:cell division protein ZipA n=1 Tax=Halioglobus sp. Uisw_031 TaxID=3230977 RepID=UPI0039EBCD17
MDLTIRDWMVVVGVLLIVAVLLDAWRRIRRDRSAEVKMKLVDNEELSVAPEQDFSMFGELPNGGARVVDRSDILRATGYEVGTDKSPPTEHDELVAGMTSTAPDGDIEDIDWLDGLGSEDGPSEVVNAQPAPSRLVSQEEPEVFMFNVVARSKQGFHGGDILHILLACDLRFGDMGFFHRHELEAGRGAVQFSVTNMMQPGVFDIDNMADMATPGLVFFLTLPGPDDMMQAFDYMLETAKTVARNLDADVLDESRSVVSKQTMEHSRQKVRDLELRLLAKAH